MQRNTIFFIAVEALHVSGGFPGHHQELEKCTYSIWYLASLIAATASYASGSSVSCRFDDRYQASALKRSSKTCMKLNSAECAVENS
jgi:hypothetical protein